MTKEHIQLGKNIKSLCGYPHILKRLYEINNNLRPYPLIRHAYFAQQAISKAQLLMPVRWVQHYMAGLHYIGENSQKLALRKFFPRYKKEDDIGACTRSTDVNSRTALSGLPGSCLDIYGDKRYLADGATDGGLSCYVSCIEQKREIWNAHYAIPIDKCGLSNGA